MKRLDYPTTRHAKQAKKYNPEEFYGTIQQVNYKSTENSNDHRIAWVLEDTYCCRKIQATTESDARYVTTDRVQCTFCFIAGPNAQRRPNHDWLSSRSRAFNKKAAEQYGTFKRMTRAALDAAFDSLILKGIPIAIVSAIGCGSHAGPHKDQIRQDFLDVIDESLDSIAFSSSDRRLQKRAEFFRKVLVPMQR